jgi:hypothetical protein
VCGERKGTSKTQRNTPKKGRKWNQPKPFFLCFFP